MEKTTCEIGDARCLTHQKMNAITVDALEEQSGISRIIREMPPVSWSTSN